MKLPSYATYGLAIVITTEDQDLVNDFGYKSEGKFKEELRRRVMTALADMPHITSLDINFANGLEGEALEELLESMEEEGEE